MKLERMQTLHGPEMAGTKRINHTVGLLDAILFRGPGSIHFHIFPFAPFLCSVAIAKKDPLWE